MFSGENQEETIKLTMPVYESNSYFPLDYRTRKQMVNDYIRDRISSMIRNRLKVI